jgi:hypothetical protein
MESNTNTDTRQQREALI